MMIAFQQEQSLQLYLNRTCYKFFLGFLESFRDSLDGYFSFFKGNLRF